MFDYDTRPITPQVVLVGNRASSAGYTIRDFLSRNGVPYDWEYCFPPEDRRAWQAYGVASGVNNILVINHVATPGRVTAILVNKTLGF